MIRFNIQKLSSTLADDLKKKIDAKTKPVGSLGVLEDLALQIGLIQNTIRPSLSTPHILVFAGDHGIVSEGVSAYPQDVTWQMVMNFVQGGAAINVFCKQHSITLHVIDAGVNYGFNDHIDGIIHSKIAAGTKNFAYEPAMSHQQVAQAIEAGARIVKNIHQVGCNVVGFGEMGIGNTSSASVIMSLICNIPIEDCVGKGTGLDDHGLQHKIDVLRNAIARHSDYDTPENILATFGGFEIAQMVGGMLQAAELNMIILIDGFITTSAYLIAHAIEPAIQDYTIFCHQSKEKGHQRMLHYLNAKPLLDLNMRLGEGSGVAVAYPILQSAVSFFNEMASFESASVSTSV